MFIPSLIADNPALDAPEYLNSLEHLPPLERERLARGDWAVQERNVFLAEWLQYFVLVGEQYELLDRQGGLLTVIPQQACRRFVTVDPAGTSSDIERDEKSGSRSYSVVQVWDQPRKPGLSHLLIFRDQVREQTSINDLCRLIRTVHRAWRPERIWIEAEKLGHALKTMLQQQDRSFPVELVPTRSRDKPTRAAPLANKMERGEVFLPKFSPWRLVFEAELLAWTGHSRQPADQIDAAAYAAILAAQHSPGPITIQHLA